MSKIKGDQVVSIHYTLKDEDGAVLESSTGQDPLVYLHGHGNIIPGLENALEGQEVGYKGSVDVEPEDGYGEYDESLVFEVERALFKGSKDLKAGAVFQLQAEEGDTVIARVVKIGKTSVQVDGNHPMAGLKLHFDFEVMSVREATKEELEHGHVHGEGGCGHHH
jgi:FKBP-type peptidyl-prolyl cis-trans isomerase SlyD